MASARHIPRQTAPIRRRTGRIRAGGQETFHGPHQDFFPTLSTSRMRSPVQSRAVSRLGLRWYARATRKTPKVRSARADQGRERSYSMSVRLFVGGLSFSTSTERLRETFARYGGVDSAAVMTDRETGRSRGFGFVEMASSEEAEQAIGALNGSSLDGRTIRVDKATPRGAAPSRSGAFERRPSGTAPGGGAPRRMPSAPGAGPRGPSDRPGGWTPRPGGPGGRGPGGPGSGGRGPGEPWNLNAGDQRRGSGRRRDGEGKRSGSEGRRSSGLRRGAGPQRRSNDRGRRSLGDDYRTF
jgi:cold-inducible RNA-binding protein